MTSTFLKLAAAIATVGVIAAVMATDLAPLFICALVIWALYHVASGFNNSGRK